jgi:hypothetical protein
VTTPKAILESRKLLKQPASGYAFQAINQLRYLLVGLHPHNDVNMVNFVLSCQDFYIRFSAQIFKQFGQPVAYLSRDDGTAIFHAPNNVVLELMHRMGTALQLIFHTPYYTTTNSKKLRKVQGNRGISALQPIAVSAPFRGLRLREIHPLPKVRGLLSQEPINPHICVLLCYTLRVTKDQFVIHLMRQIDRHGSQKEFAAHHKISEQYISDILLDRREPGKKILDALGFERVITYRKTKER